MSDQDQPALLQISNEMVQLYKQQFGRGPTKARTDWLGSDALACTLEDSLTPAEKNLVTLGEHGRLRDIRMFFQYAYEAGVHEDRRDAYRQEGPCLHQWDRHGSRRRCRALLLRAPADLAGHFAQRTGLRIEDEAADVVARDQLLARAEPGQAWRSVASMS